MGSIAGRLILVTPRFSKVVRPLLCFRFSLFRERYLINAKASVRGAALSRMAAAGAPADHSYNPVIVLEDYAVSPSVAGADAGLSRRAVPFGHNGARSGLSWTERFRCDFWCWLLDMLCSVRVMR